MKVVALSGSLRSSSSNTAVLRAAAAVAPEGMEVTVFEDVGGLPHFSPDLDTDAPPVAVRRFRALLAPAEGIVVSTPEYAHGLPGSFKNALDWLVSSGELYGKPVLVVNASSGGGEWAQASLTQVLTVMDAKVLTESTVALPLARKKLSDQGHLADPETTRALTRGLEALAAAIRAR
jgi:chromate reductase, NAD(P)H dehydrogenase (quinone)